MKSSETASACLTDAGTSEVNESALGILPRQNAHINSAKTVVCFAIPLTTSFANRIETELECGIPWIGFAAIELGRV